MENSSNNSREISVLREELRYKEQERDRIWESYWFICWIFLPIIGWIMLIITIVTRMNKSSRLERECREIREQIYELKAGKF